MGRQGSLSVAKCGRTLSPMGRRVDRKHSTSNGRMDAPEVGCLHQCLMTKFNCTRSVQSFDILSSSERRHAINPRNHDRAFVGPRARAVGPGGPMARPRPGAVLVDGTLGGGGHARALAAERGTRRTGDRHRPRSGGDRGRRARTLRGLPVRLVQANFCDLPEVLNNWTSRRWTACMLDLGVSSDQLADRSRGFSFSADGPLDLRFDPMSGEPARRLINRLSAEHLAELISSYGEERYSRRIARAIVERRRHSRSRRPRSWPSWSAVACRARRADSGSIRPRGRSRPCESR